MSLPFPNGELDWWYSCLLVWHNIEETRKSCSPFSQGYELHTARDWRPSDEAAGLSRVPLASKHLRGPAGAWGREGMTPWGWGVSQTGCRLKASLVAVWCLSQPRGRAGRSSCLSSSLAARHLGIPRTRLQTSLRLSQASGCTCNKSPINVLAVLHHAGLQTRERNRNFLFLFSDEPVL